GVDAFFAISGFLITAHLLSHPPGNGRDLARFWSRRIRRLLPASLLVLAVTLVASRIVGPETQWARTARQAQAATLYVVNWALARDSVDYLNAENAPSPVQHFWSLSVEEQFYFVWPIAILLLVLLARRTGWRTSAVVGTGLTLVVAASLTYSITETASNPAAAYFVTPTRMWELGLGGLLALVTAPRVLGRADHTRTPPRAVALVLAWGGLAAIAWSALTYSASTPFPGWQALVPVLGTVFVMAANPTDDPLSPGGLLALRPAQWLGDVSYSVYLWHWPMVVLLPAVSGGRIGNLDRVVIVVATLVLAGLTKTFVEDRFRSTSWGIPLRKPYLLGATAMMLVVGLAGAQLVEVGHRQDQSRIALQRAISAGNPCFGAGALDAGRRCRAVPYDQVVPAPVDAAQDKSNAYSEVSGKKNCWSWQPRFPQVHCTFGNTHAPVRVVLVGNSHAGEWLPALEALARQKNWRIDTFLANRCASAEVPQTFANPSWSASCMSWTTRTVQAIAASHPNLVVMTNRVSVPAVGYTFATTLPAYQRGYAKVLKTWQRAGVNVLVLHDTPSPGASIPDCLAQHQPNYTACDGTPSKWITKEPAAKAVAALAYQRIMFADLNNHICGPRRCTAVTGGVVTYFDASHLTATYATTLAPYLAVPMETLLAH
ncbi:MAG: acyltransferase, partial [Actinomycetota bacterium]|nr:acyltransferase [Actinomycetota bacterium]